MLRTDVVARVLGRELASAGPTSEARVIAHLEDLAPGRADEVVSWARSAGIVHRRPDADADDGTMLLEAAGVRQRVAA